MASPKDSPRVLIVDDDRNALALLQRILETEGFAIEAAGGGQEAINRLESSPFDLVISDIRMGDVDGFDVLAAARRVQPETPVVLLTAFGDIDGAMDAIRKGAWDYLPRPYDVEGLRRVCARAIAQKRLVTENQKRKRASKQDYRLSSIIGRSPNMLEVYKMVARIAPSEIPVLIVGESGTGKELVARAIHSESTRSERPFVAINCGALADGVLESELFGHERGAFTGAMSARAGLFEEADGGTIFLDEIDSVSPRMQTRLLRVLQEHEIRRVGASQSLRVNVRVLAATNADLNKKVADGDFREDLYYRLNGVTIRLPPLRERREDIPLLVEHFLARAERETGKSVGISPEAMNALVQYEWAGNVRELENAILSAVALCRSQVIVPAELPPTIVPSEIRSESDGLWVGDWPPLEEVSRRYAKRVLEREGGNKTKAAALLGIDRKTLYRLLEGHR